MSERNKHIGRYSALHVAAMNGHVNSTSFLLESPIAGGSGSAGFFQTATFAASWTGCHGVSTTSE